MGYDPAKHHRRSIRYPGYDYSAPGAYFVTICVHERRNLLGEVADGQVRLSLAGEMVRDWWLKLPGKFAHLALDEYVIMPNHMHGLTVFLAPLPDEMLTGSSGKQPLPDPNLPRVVQWFKTMTTNAYIRGVKNSNWPAFRRYFWQRNYWEHIVRNDGDLMRLRDYIQTNPQRWQADQLHPDAPPNAFNQD